MSGGFFDYKEFHAADVAEQIEQIIAENGRPGHDCYDSHSVSLMREAVTKLREAYIYAHRVDWLLSGDDSSGAFDARLRADLTELHNKG